MSFVPHNDANEEVKRQWKQMEKYGFKVTDDFCLIPHKQYWGSRGHRGAGHTLSPQFFYNRKAHKKPKNSHGWPCDEQYSHLCHVWNCVSPDCVVVEERWKNVKRNYCGLNGACDCGSTPKCTRMYHNKDHQWNLTYLSYDTPRLKERIMEYTDAKFTILPKDHYRSQDLKRKNRVTRNKRNKKQKK